MQRTSTAEAVDRADGTATGQVVTAPLEKLDLFFTLALVVKM